MKQGVKYLIIGEKENKIQLLDIKRFLIVLASFGSLSGFLLAFLINF